MDLNIVNIRRVIHQYPELSENEFQTQKLIIEYLKYLNIPYLTINTGVIGIINENKEGKTIGVRADIDALPINELNDIEYKSLNKGVMHACGHDAHTAILIGVAKRLIDIKDNINGRIILIFEYAEETVGGAKIMREHSLIKQCDYIIGLHVSELINVGQIALKNDQAHASSDTITLTILGKNSHATKPHMGIDAILISAYLLTMLQSVITRNLNPLDEAVLSFGKINGGVAHNVICDEVIIKGTLRTFKKEIRDELKRRIVQIVKGVSESYECKIRLDIEEGYPSLINNNEINHVIERCAINQLGSNNVIYKTKPSLGVESFAYYLEEHIGAFYQLGIKNDLMGINAPVHSSTFMIDENALEIGVSLQTDIILNLLGDNLVIK